MHVQKQGAAAPGLIRRPSQPLLRVTTALFHISSWASLPLDMYKANPHSSMSRHSSSWIFLDPRSRPELGCESLQVPATWQARLQSQHLRGRTSHCYPTSCPSLTALSSTACAISVLLGTDLTGDAPKSGPSACPCQKAASCVASSCRVTVASLPWDCLQ